MFHNNGVFCESWNRFERVAVSRQERLCPKTGTLGTSQCEQIWRHFAKFKRLWQFFDGSILIWQIFVPTLAN